MSRNIAAVFAAAIMLSTIPEASAQNRRQTPPPQPPLTVESIKESIRKDQPRLIATEDRVNKIKQRMQTDPKFAQLVQKYKSNTDAILTQEPVKHELAGPRLLHQSRQAMNRVYALGLAYRLFEDQKYLDRLEKELLTVSNFPDWNPSHFLDTAEMTHAVAIGYDWFRHKWSPETRETIRTAIVRHGLEPGLELINRKQKRPHWVRTKNNWNQVCYGGLSLGALAIYDDNPKIATQMLNHARNNLRFAMPEFSPDGGWIEGPGYWDYTTYYCFFLFAGLDTALGTTWGYTDTPGFKDTGFFIPAMEGPTGQFFNWGDGSTKLGNLPQLFWMAEYFKNPMYAWLGRKQMKGNPNALDLLFYSDEGNSPHETDLKKDWVFKGIDVASMRENWNSSNASFVALKGGDNDAPHSNLDLGAFVFDSQGIRWAIELGSDNYNLPNYWNREKRLVYYRINSFGQNILILNNKNQNPKGKAKILKQTSQPNAAYTTVDLNDAYSDLGTSVTRGFALAGNRKQLIIQDDVTVPQETDFQWQFHTQAAITVSPDGKSADLRQDGKILLVKAESPVDYKIIADTAKQDPPQNPNKGINKLVIKGKFPAGTTSLRVTLTPDSETPYSAPMVPVSKW